MDWMITVDRINKGGEFDSPSRAGRIHAKRAFIEALRTMPPGQREVARQAFKEGMTHEFRLFDDDGEMYYEGLCKDLDDQHAESAFEPLDWAESDAGCTRMDYRKVGTKKWETL